MKGFLKILLSIFMVFVVSGCDSNELSSGTDPSVSNPTTAVATNVGPVEQLVATDVLDKANEIVGSVAEYQDEMYGEDNPFNLTKQIKKVGMSEQTEEIDLSEDVSCDVAGTKSIIGSVDFTVGADQLSGSIVGSFVIQYNNCQDIILMETSNGNCAITPTVTGDVTTTVSADLLFGAQDTGQDYSYEADFSASTQVALDVTVGSSAADQSYSFTYYLANSSSSNNLNGVVSYAGNSYDMSDVESYVEDSATTAICE